MNENEKVRPAEYSRVVKRHDKFRLILYCRVGPSQAVEQERTNERLTPQNKFCQIVLIKTGAKLVLKQPCVLTQTESCLSMVFSFANYNRHDEQADKISLPVHATLSSCRCPLRTKLQPDKKQKNLNKLVIFHLPSGLVDLLARWTSLINFAFQTAQQSYSQ